MWQLFGIFNRSAQSTVSFDITGDPVEMIGLLGHGVLGGERGLCNQNAYWRNFFQVQHNDYGEIPGNRDEIYE